MLTSRSLSSSFYFVFHDNVMMMFYVTMQWVKWLSVSSLVVGFRVRNPHGEQQKKNLQRPKWRSNWSPWQQSKISSCLLLVDIVIIVVIQITAICTIMLENHLGRPSLLLPSTRTTSKMEFTFTLHRQIHHLVPGLTVIVKGHQISERLTLQEKLSSTYCTWDLPFSVHM